MIDGISFQIKGKLAPLKIPNLNPSRSSVGAITENSPNSVIPISFGIGQKIMSQSILLDKNYRVLAVKNETKEGKVS